MSMAPINDVDRIGNSGRGNFARRSHRLDDALGRLLGVAERHHGVVAVEQRIVDSEVDL